MSVAALLLPIICFKDILNEKGSLSGNVNCPILISWALIFQSIGCGIWYEYVATKKIAEGKGRRKRYPEFLFGITLGSFYVGIGFFLIESFRFEAF